MGLEITIDNLDDMCDLMCGNIIPKKENSNYYDYLAEKEELQDRQEEIEREEYYESKYRKRQE